MEKRRFTVWVRGKQVGEITAYDKNEAQRKAQMMYGPNAKVR